MMHNVEIKIELRDPELALAILRRLGAAEVGAFEQTDTYYRVARGRLKRRESPGEPLEYVFYERPDEARPRVSRFVIFSESQARSRFGEGPLPVWVVVRKRRQVLVHGPVRIHLDTVENLGRFLELEAMVTPACDEARCRRAVDELREALTPALGEPVSAGYADLAAGGPATP